MGHPAYLLQADCSPDTEKRKKKNQIKDNKKKIDCAWGLGAVGGRWYRSGVYPPPHLAFALNFGLGIKGQNAPIFLANRGRRGGGGRGRGDGGWVGGEGGRGRGGGWGRGANPPPTPPPPPIYWQVWLFPS